MITKELLQRFCNVDRESLAVQFTQGEYTYASDGRLIVRVPRLDDVPENPDAPKNVAMNIFAATPFRVKEDRTPISALTIPPLEGPDDCANCQGGGIHFCEACDDHHDCTRCEGGKVQERAIAVEFKQHKISHLLLNQIKDLPNVSLAASAIGMEAALAFFFDGGEGRMMPMRDPEEVK